MCVQRVVSWRGLCVYRDLSVDKAFCVKRELLVDEVYVCVESCQQTKFLCVHRVVS